MTVGTTPTRRLAEQRAIGQLEGYGRENTFFPTTGNKPVIKWI